MFEKKMKEQYLFYLPPSKQFEWSDTHMEVCF